MAITKPVSYTHLDQGGLDAANLAKIQEFSPTEFRALEENTEMCIRDRL